MDTPALVKERLLREADAMVLYIASRGIEKDSADPALMKLLDANWSERENLPMKDVVALHKDLAAKVAPAFPETVYRLHTFGQWRILSSVAPLPSIVWLIGVTLVMIALFAFGMTRHSHIELPASYELAQQEIIADEPSAPPASVEITALQDAAAKEKSPYFAPVIEYLQGQCRFSEQDILTAADVTETDQVAQRNAALLDHYNKCNALKRAMLLRLFTFFALLGMLGAAYSSIYDSFTYAREGRYDMRLSSSYYVRIMLGGFSGVLLAEPLSAFLEQGMLSSALLAFIGGFSAQLVYDLLTKLVDSVANMFRADRRKEIQATLAQAQYNANAIILKDDANKRAILAEMFGEAQKEPNPEARAAKMQDAILSMLSGKLPDTLPIHGVGADLPILGQLTDAGLFSDLSRHLAELLPDAPNGAADAASAAKAEIGQMLASLKVSDDATTQARALAALDVAERSDLVSAKMVAGIEALKTALNGAALAAAAKGALAANTALTPAQIARCRYVAYSATGPTPAVIEGLSSGDMIGNGLTAPDGTELSIETLLDTISRDDLDDVFAMSGDGFEDRTAFDTALNGWLDTQIRSVLARELEANLIPIIGGTHSGAALVEILSDIAGHETARGGLQLLELIGSGVPASDMPDALLTRLLARADAHLAGEVSS